MKKFIFIFIFVPFLCFTQDFPINPNAYDSLNNKTGKWTIFYDIKFDVTNNFKFAKYYRIINYEKGIPKGKVFDYYLNQTLLKY